MKANAKQVAQVSVPVVEARPIVSETIATGITIEMVLYSIVLIVAAGLRWINLGVAPLSTHEAEQALAALNGTPLPMGGSPLLYSFNQILFGLFGSSVGDLGVRLGAALIGTAMVLLPALYRKQIGRIGSIAASAMLAISPTITYASRRLDGQIIAAACALAVIGFGLRYLESRQQRDAIGVGISIGLGLTSGPGIVTLLIALAIGVLIVYRWSTSDEERAAVAELREGRDHVRQAAGWGGAVFVLAATVVLLRLESIRSVPELVSAWLAASHGFDTIGVLQLFQIMLIDEPLIVWFGLAGILYAIARGSRTSIVLSVWSIGALIVTLLQPGRQTVDLVLMLAPLALLAGQVVQRLADDLTRHGAWQLEGAVWLLGVPLAGYLAITMSSYAIGRGLAGDAQVLGQTLDPAASFAVLLVLMCLIVGAVFALAIGLGAVRRAAVAALVMIFAMISIGNTWSVTQTHASDPREPLLSPSVTTGDVRPMMEAIEAASVRATGNRWLAAITVALPQSDPVLAWYLRQFKNAQFTAAPDAQVPVAITPDGTEPSAQPGSYIGAKFVTRSTWSSAQLIGANFLRWWLYREADQPSPVQTLVVWVKTAQ